MSTAGAVTQYDNTTYISSISSGLDTNSLVNAAVAQKTASADRIDVKIEKNDLRSSEYKELQNLSQTLEESLEKLRSKNYSSLGASNDFDQKLAYLSSSTISSPEDYIAISVEDKAIVASYNIEVTQIAQKMKVTSALQGNASLGLSGEFSLGLDGMMGGPISITPDMTISDITAQINATSRETGIHATLITIDDNNTQLVLSADRTAAQISYASVSGDDIFASLGLVDNLGAFSNVTQAAQPAKMIIDGNEIIRNSNEISDAISGVNFSLLNAEPGSVIKIDINPDYNTVKKSIIEFIDSYNALREFILNQQALTDNGAVSEDSILFADTLLRNMDAGIYNILNASSYGASTNINILSELGIEMDSSNRLHLADEDKLDTLLLSDFSALENFFETSYQSSDSRLRILKNDTLNSNMNFSLALTADDQGKITDVLVDGQSGLFNVQDNLITGKEGTLYEGLSFAITLDPLESTTINVNLEAGFADSLGNYLNVYSNNLDGLVQNEITRLSENNSTLEEEAAKIRHNAEIYRQREVEKYAKMETELQNAELLRKQINAILGDNEDD